MSNEDSNEDPVRVARRVTVWSIALGVLLILAGSLGLVYVVAATITSAILFAWLLLMAGTAALVDAWQRRGRDGFWAGAITAVLNLGAGLVILWKPTESIVALTMLVAVFLLVGGMFRVVGGIAGRVPGAGWLVLHGLVDVLLAALIIADFPSWSYYVLGVFLSVSLLVDGAALVTLGSVAHRGLGRIVGFGSTSGATPTSPRPA